MNLNDSLASHNETLVALMNEGATLCGADETATDAERHDALDRWRQCLEIISPIERDLFLLPDGMFTEGGEVGFYYEQTSLMPGTENAARILRWMQDAHAILKAHFLQ